MTDFETFVIAIGRLDEDGRRTVLGDEYVLYPPDEDLDYSTTPKGAVAFGTMGVDGVHYIILKLEGEIRDESPVIHFSPMDFSSPYTLLGHTFAGYLATVCGVSENKIHELMVRERSGENILVSFLRCNLDHGRLDLDRFGSQVEKYAHLLPPVDP